MRCRRCRGSIIRGWARTGLPSWWDAVAQRCNDTFRQGNSAAIGETGGGIVASAAAVFSPIPSLGRHAILTYPRVSTISNVTACAPGSRPSAAVGSTISRSLRLALFSQESDSLY
jgi:hypothetical protein